MLRNAIVVLILLLLALGVADARLPQVGDYVHIQGNYGNYNGKIMSIGDGFICLNGSVGSVSGGREKNVPIDVCIGIGCISELTWVS